MARTIDTDWNEKRIAERTASDGTGQTFTATRLHCRPGGVGQTRERKCYAIRLGCDPNDHDIAKGGCCIFAPRAGETMHDALARAVDCWMRHAND